MLSNPYVSPLLFAVICGSIPRVVVYRNSYGLSVSSAQSEEDAISGSVVSGLFGGLKETPAPGLVS